MVFFNEICGISAFEPENVPSGRYTSVIRSVMSLSKIISSLCDVAETVDFHKEDFAQLVIAISSRYYEKCFEWFDDFVSLEPGVYNNHFGGLKAEVKISAEWAHDETILDILKPTLLELEDIDPSVNSAEMDAELQLKGGKLLREDDLILDVSILNSIARLYTTLKWFILNMVEVRKVSEVDADADADNLDIELMMGNMAINETLENLSLINTKIPRLYMTKEMSFKFDELLYRYQQLAETCLLTLRIELRVHIMYYLEKTFVDSDFTTSVLDASELSPPIADLASDSAMSTAQLMTLLPNEEYLFVVGGLVEFIDNLLIQSAENIRVINETGITQMELDISALEQSLRMLYAKPVETTLKNARKYYSLLNADKNHLKIAVKENEFTMEQICTMVQLQFSERLHHATQTGDHELSAHLRKAATDLIEEIKSIM